MLLGFYALFTGVVVLNHIWTAPKEIVLDDSAQIEVKETTVSAIGIGMGVISGLLGISGGILSTPMQQTYLKIPLKNAIANTITTAIFCSFTASVFILITGLYNADFKLADVIILVTILVPGNFVGGQFGGFFAKRLDINFVRIIFAAVAFIIGFRIILS